MERRRALCSLSTQRERERTGCASEAGGVDACLTQRHAGHCSLSSSLVACRSGDPASARPPHEAPVSESERASLHDPTWQLGQFEMHTKGVGARLLAQMGYREGQGLGKALQGRVDPLLPAMRAKRVGLGM